MPFSKHPETPYNANRILASKRVIDEVVVAVLAGRHLFGCGWTFVTDGDIQNHYHSGPPLPPLDHCFNVTTSGVVKLNPH